MGRSIVKCVVYAITICVLYGVIEYLNNRNNSVKGSSQDDTHYIVRVPSALKYVYMTMFILGIILFVVFLLFKAKGNASVTNGSSLVLIDFCRNRIAGNGMGIQMEYSCEWIRNGSS